MDVEALTFGIQSLESTERLYTLLYDSRIYFWDWHVYGSSEVEVVEVGLIYGQAERERRKKNLLDCDLNNYDVCDVELCVSPLEMSSSVCLVPLTLVLLFPDLA